MKQKLLTLLAALGCYSSFSQSITLDWVKNLEGTEYSSVNTYICSTTTGDILAAGSFSDTVDFDPSPVAYTLAAQNAGMGYSDVYFGKYDHNGHLLFVNRIGGDDDEWLAGIRTDQYDNIYIFGEYNGLVDFDPSADTFNLNGVPNSKFIAKYDPNGNLVYALSIDPTNSLTMYDLEVDVHCNVFACGDFRGSVDFDPTPLTHSCNSGLYTTFGYLAGFDSTGAFRFVNTVGVSASSHQNSFVRLFTDASGNIITSGIYEPSADFDPGPGTAYGAGTVPTGTFLAKYDNNGAFLWEKDLYNVDGGVVINGFEHDASGAIYIATSIIADTRPIDFDPSPASHTITSSNAFLASVSRYDASGNFEDVWAFETDSLGYGEISYITFDSNNNVYLTGHFDGIWDFDLSAGTDIHQTNQSFEDFFIAKYTSGGNLFYAESFGSPSHDDFGGSPIIHNNEITIAGRYDAPFDFDPSPTSVVSFAPVNAVYGFIARYSETTTGLKQVSANGTIVYPNPFSETLYIQGNAPGYHVRIISSLGEEVLSAVIVGNSSVDTKRLSPGWYVVEVTVGNQLYRQKLIKY